MWDKAFVLRRCESYRRKRKLARYSLLYGSSEVPNDSGNRGDRRLG